MVHILLIEDNGADALLVREAIRLSFVEVYARIVGDGWEALRSLNSFTPDLIILDLGIPTINGLEVLDRYRREEGDAPVVVFTGFANRVLQARAFELGVKEYIVKPTDLDEFIGTIQSAIERWTQVASTSGA